MILRQRCRVLLNRRSEQLCFFANTWRRLRRMTHRHHVAVSHLPLWTEKVFGTSERQLQLAGLNDICLFKRGQGDA